MKKVLPFCLLLILGCSGNRDAGPPENKALLKQEPEGAKDVIALRKEAKHGEDVVAVGRVGGLKEAIVKGRAVFSIVDNSLKPCPDEEGCPTPWDFCCHSPDEIIAASATVKIVNDKGETLTEDVRQNLGVRELKTVVVRGQAQRDDQGNLTILAKGIFVRP